MTGSFTSGLGAQLGFAAEAAYGAYKAPTKFLEFEPEALKLARAYLESKQLRAGRMYQSGSRRIATTRSAAGTVGFEVPSQGFGPVLNLFTGETVVPVVQEATIAYLQTYNIGTSDPFKKSLTMQFGRPTTAGIVEPFTYTGVVGISLAISVKTGGFVTATLTLDAQNESLEQALAVPSFPTALHSFNFTQAKVTLGGEELKELDGLDLTISTAKKVTRFPLGSELKNVPLTNAYMDTKINLESEYGSNAMYKLFEKDEKVPLTIAIVGDTIVGTQKEELTFTVAECGLDGETPNVAGPEVLKQTVPVVVLDNETEPPLVVKYKSTDKAL